MQKMNNRTLLLLSKGVSYIGTKLFSFALSWYILSQTGSGLSFSISLVVNYLPTIAMSLFAGRLSDKTTIPIDFWCCATWPVRAFASFR